MPRKRSSTKSRIVKAAWNLFYKKGYDGTTVEDIIALSKTSKGTFYHYFKGKEALLNSISDLFDSKYEELRSEIDPNLSAYNTLLYLNRELFHMIETSIDVNLIAFLYSSSSSRKTTALFLTKTVCILCGSEKLSQKRWSPENSPRTPLRMSC